MNRELGVGDPCPRRCGTPLRESGEGDLWCIACGWRKYSGWTPQSPTPVDYGRPSRITSKRHDIINLEASLGFA